MPTVCVPLVKSGIKNMNRCMTWHLVAAMWFLCPATIHGAEQPDQPNIVFILADDLGYGDVKAFGGDRCNVDTPHFDRLCTEGMKFTDAHVTDSVCVPSRT